MTDLKGWQEENGTALSVAIEALRKVPVSYNTESGFTELEAEAIFRRLAGSEDVAVALRT